MTKISGNKSTSIFDFYNLTEASFQMFLTSIPEQTLPILTSMGKRNFKNSSKCEIVMAQMLSSYHRKMCKSVPFR